MLHYWSLLVDWMFAPHWIVNEYGELGVRFCGVNFYYYKWDTPLIYERYKADGVYKGPAWRIVGKREFGECVISQVDFDDPIPLGPDAIGFIPDA